MTPRFASFGPRHAVRPVARAAAFGLAALALAPSAHAQYTNRWLSAGSMHNWYSEIGAEREEGLKASQQQNGLRWPAIYTYTDAQAAMGLWIGAKDVRAPNGQTFSTRVVHSGPRARGTDEFFPVKFEVVSRFDVPTVTVNNETSEGETTLLVDRVDPSLRSDAMIYSEVNTLLGLTVIRRIHQFSNEYHDNYHLVEVVARNTGNADADPEVELAGHTLKDLVISWQYRLAPTRESRYVIGNATGWGKNTMLDFRGDGLANTYNDPANERDLRAMYVWHGYFPDKAISYNNIGGPILRENVPQAASGVLASDTLGRLAGSQFVGLATLFASGAANGTTNDPAQPRFMSYRDSDSPELSNNDAFTLSKMETEYGIITADAQNRHANAVTGSNDRASFLTQRQDPALGGSGGPSGFWGFGPYTLAPGDSVKIVYAIASAGLSRQNAALVGRAYKAAVAPLTGDARNGDPVLPVTINGRSGLTKNGWVFTGRDSLFQTFRRAQAAYDAGLRVDAPPAPPASFSVTGGGDRIQLRWDASPGATGYEVYRSAGLFTERDTLLTRTPLAASATSYDDESATRGINYYYYIRALGGTTTGTAGVPAGRTLKSSRYWTQTYLPARLLRLQGVALDRVRVVPNPYYFGAAVNRAQQTGTRYYDQQDKIGFLDIPGRCTIAIYTELGEKVTELRHTDGSGDQYWDLSTASGQSLASGIYVAIITVTEDIVAQTDVRDPMTGQILFRTGEKMYAAGEQTFRKFVVIR